MRGLNANFFLALVVCSGVGFLVCGGIATIIGFQSWWDFLMLFPSYVVYEMMFIDFLSKLEKSAGAFPQPVGDNMGRQPRSSAFGYEVEDHGYAYQDGHEDGQKHCDGRVKVGCVRHRLG